MGDLVLLLSEVNGKLGSGVNRTLPFEFLMTQFQGLRVQRDEVVLRLSVSAPCPLGPQLDSALALALGR